jgi:hypothetical protein
MCRFQFVLRPPTRHCSVLVPEREPVPVQELELLVRVRELSPVRYPRHCRLQADPIHRQVVRRSVYPSCHSVFEQFAPNCCRSCPAHPNLLAQQLLPVLVERRLPARRRLNLNSDCFQAGYPSLAAVAGVSPSCPELHSDFHSDLLAPSHLRFRPRLSFLHRHWLRREGHPRDCCPALLQLPVLVALLFQV